MGNKTSAKNSLSANALNKEQFDLDTHTDDVFGLITLGYIRENSNDPSSIPTDVKLLCLKYYRIVNLIISENKQTKLYCCNNYYLFNSILIKQNGTLTVNKWNSASKKGGTLLMRCIGDIILEQKACIDLNGIGYSGGKGTNMTGESYNSISIQQSNANVGGGGGGKGRCAGGGGYGTNGKNGDNLYDKGPQHVDQSGVTYKLSSVMGKGGNTYGDKKLSVLHLGSGGGSVMNENGGSGGGALMIVCFGNIILNKKACITCNGLEGIGNKSGCGSGGSIHIITQTYENIEMDMKSQIKAIGGKNFGQGGDGGNGRVRIQFMNKSVNIKTAKKYLSNFEINPEPFVG